MPKIKLISLLPFIFIAGCTVTGPADDGYENSNEWVDNGRLFSEESKTFSSTVSISAEQVTNDNTSDGSPEDRLDYDAYQQWLQAKQKNSAEYQKFKQWQEFEAYQRWKEQQPSQ